MFKCKKKTGKLINAYRLGDDSPVLLKLVKSGKIVHHADGSFAVLSQEAALAGSMGQVAENGDYIKMDSSGYPYPNKHNWFESHHRHIEGDKYEQIPETLDAWTVDEPDCDEVRFLIEYKGLNMNAEDPAHFFTAPLWGTMESASKDAVVIFYHVTYSIDGGIQDIDFNFVERNEFNSTYELL